MEVLANKILKVQRDIADLEQKRSILDEKIERGKALIRTIMDGIESWEYKEEIGAPCTKPLESSKRNLGVKARVIHHMQSLKNNFTIADLRKTIKENDTELDRNLSENNLYTIINRGKDKYIKVIREKQGTKPGIYKYVTH
jgi:hypothetical protein